MTKAREGTQDPEGTQVLDDHPRSREARVPCVGQTR